MPSARASVNVIVTVNTSADLAFCHDLSISDGLLEELSLSCRGVALDIDEDEDARKG